MKKNITRICAMLLCLLLAMGNVSQGAETIEGVYPSEVILAEETSDETDAADDVVAADIARLDEMLPAEIGELSGRDQAAAEKVVSIAGMDAAAAAESLNGLEDDAVYEAALHEILDMYYAEDLAAGEEAISAFAEAADSRADEMLADYAEAKEERDNQANLDYEAGKVITVFEAGVTEDEIREVAERMGDGYTMLSDFEINEDLPAYKLERLHADGDKQYPSIVYMDIGLDKTVDRAEEILETLSCVEGADRNSTNIETDSLQTELGVNDPGVNSQTYLSQIKAPGAWKAFNNTAINAYETHVAVIDTGMDISHEDLKNVYLDKLSVCITKDANDNFIKSQMTVNNCYIRDTEDSYHGTAVAGIIAAQSNNGKGIAGTASMDNGLIKIMAINAAYKGVNKDGLPAAKFDGAVTIQAIQYAVNNGAEVINLSLGDTKEISGMQAAIDYAYGKGVVVCASAGNDDGYLQAYYPASYNHVMAVGAVTSSNTKAGFSNYGPYVDIAAPGKGIYSCDIGTTSYITDNGTSFSTPMVSATAAMLYSMQNYQPPYRLSPDTIESILYSTATDLYSAGKDDYTGYGLLNMEKAVQEAKARLIAGIAPGNVTAAQSSYHEVKIAWNWIPWADAYKICRSASVNGTYEKIKTIYYMDADVPGKRMSYVDSGLNTGTTYYYKVQPFSKDGSSFRYGAFSAAVSAKPSLSTPGIDLSTATGQIRVWWTKVAGADGYAVFRSTSKNGTYSRVKKVTGGSTLSWADTSVKSGKTYYYKVRALRTVNGNTVVSGFSSIASLTSK